jgi:hypothetical protein
MQSPLNSIQMKNNIIAFPAQIQPKQLDDLIFRSTKDVNKIADLFRQVEKGLLTATEARSQYSELIQAIINDHHDIVLMDQKLSNP